MEPAGNSHGLSKTAAGMNESRARETEEHPGMVHGGQNQEGSKMGHHHHHHDDDHHWKFFRRLSGAGQHDDAHPSTEAGKGPERAE